ncbi:hypothetical protein PVAP13_7KG202200 [Panicum virgatum]|uniref:Uncharacterized protein n=1 Tax=Panicum virgatum TaxID=38727 RepID=A0A8T0QFI2_PANVG|nr:hypothetical protein PVAP13_7KG202200 [Panicum virgatum]
MKPALRASSFHRGSGELLCHPKRVPSASCPSRACWGSSWEGGGELRLSCAWGRPKGRRRGVTPRRRRDRRGAAPWGGRRESGGESRLAGEEAKEELRRRRGRRERRVGRREHLAEGRGEQQLAGEEAQGEPGRADGSCGS